MLADFEVNWDDNRIVEIENQLMQGIFSCRSTEAVEAAITYAKFLSSVGISPENYPVFLKILEIENHWVIDALIGGRDPLPDAVLSSAQYLYYQPNIRNDDKMAQGRNLFQEPFGHPWRPSICIQYT